MKKYLKYFLVFAGFALFLASCEKEDKTFTGDSIVAFSKTSEAFYAQEDASTYNVKVMLVGPQTGSSYQLAYSIMDSAVIGGVTYKTDVTEGVEIATISDKTYTIPSNSSFGELSIPVNFNNLLTGEKYTLVLGLEAGSLGVSPSYNPYFALIIQKYVPLDPDQFVGTFDAEEYSLRYDDTYYYEVEIVEVKDSLDGKIVWYDISGLWELSEGGNWSDVQALNVKLDDRDPANPLVTMAEVSDFAVHATFGQVVWNAIGNGSFDAASSSMVLPTGEVEVPGLGFFDWGLEIKLTKSTVPGKKARAYVTRVRELD